MPRLAALLLFVTISLTTDVSAQPLAFARDDYASASGARAIAIADFDRDGWPDLAQGNVGRNTVTVLLNQHGTGLARASDIAVGTGPFALAAGDFNRDGMPDLAVANADSNTITVLLGRGTGAFTRSADLAVASANPRGLVAADVNNDARTDLVYTGYASGVVQVLMGNGAGAFSAGPRYAGPALHPQGVVASDFNRDGYADVVVAYEGGSSGLRVLYGSGGTGMTVRTVAGDTSLNVLAAADLNEDGWIDLAAASTRYSRVGIYLGGASGFVHTLTYSAGSSPRGIALADVNHDGVLDIVTANRASSTVTVLPGDRLHRGNFLPAMHFAAGSGSRAVGVADFDADGRLDLATGNEYAATATILSNATVFQRAAYVFGRLALGTPSGIIGGADAVWPADFNRDGRLDVLTLAREEPWTMSILLAGGAAVSLPGTGLADGFAAADVNADGNPDVIYKGCCPTGVVNAYLGNGRGGFVAAPQSTSPSLLEQFAVGDLNRDGRPDLVFAGYNPSFDDPVLQVMIGAGNGTFRDGGRVGLPASGVDLRTADVNRDGKPDVVVLLANRTTQVWLGTGTGGLSPSSLAFTFTADGASDLKLGDLNHDGHLDVVIGGGELGATGRQASATIALGGTDAFHVAGELPITAWGWRANVLDLADVNVDGDLDIVTAGGDILPGRGDGTFGPVERFDYRAVGIRVDDYTGDGLPDVIFGTSQGEVGLLVNERNEVNRPPVATAGPDLTIGYERQVFGEGPPGPAIEAVANDPDQHALTFEWRDAGGVLVSSERGLTIWNRLPGDYEYTLTVQDGRGGSVTDSVVVTITPTKEIVLYLSSDVVSFGGNWSRVIDYTAAGWGRAYDANLGAPKVTTPLAAPTSKVSLEFIADPTQTYKLWLRLKADRNSWANDSLWVQLSGATDLAGNPKYRPGTTSGLSVSLEECLGCGVSGWGWEDDGWGAFNRNGVLLRFPGGGVQRIVLQTREDGVSVDQIVLSAEEYLTTRPGAAKNDTTILPATWTPF